MAGDPLEASFDEIRVNFNGSSEDTNWPEGTTFVDGAVFHDGTVYGGWETHDAEGKPLERRSQQFLETLCPTTHQICPQLESDAHLYGEGSDAVVTQALPDFARPEHDRAKLQIVQGAHKERAIRVNCRGPRDGECPVPLTLERESLLKRVAQKAIQVLARPPVPRRFQ